MFVKCCVLEIWCPYGSPYSVFVVMYSTLGVRQLHGALHDFGDSKVPEFDHTTFHEENILWFQVPVQDLPHVDGFDLVCVRACIMYMLCICVLVCGAPFGHGCASMLDKSV